MLSARRCAHCGRVLEEARCPCQERLAWNQLASPWPNTRNAWLLVAAMIPLWMLLCLVAWFSDNLNQVPQLLSSSVLAVPLFVQLALPTGRKRGGCCLGCWMVMAAGLGMTLALPLLARHAPPWKRETAPPARLDPRVPTTCLGLSLGATLQQVTERLGPGKELSAPQGCQRRLHPGGLDVLYRDGAAIRLSGPSLEQNGQILVRLGDPARRREQLFYQGSQVQVQPLQGLGQMQIIVACRGDRVAELVMVRSDQPREIRHPD